MAPSIASEQQQHHVHEQNSSQATHSLHLESPIRSDVIDEPSLNRVPRSTASSNLSNHSRHKLTVCFPSFPETGSAILAFHVAVLVLAGLAGTALL